MPDVAAVRSAADEQVSALLEPLARALEQEWSPLRPGERLGQYSLLYPLGAGAFSQVWAAEKVPEGTRVALKIFAPHKFPEDERLNAAVRFWQGANTASRLPPEARIVGPVQGPDITDSRLWYATRLFPEGDLFKRLKRNDLTLDERLRIVDDLLDTVATAHKSGVCHRDIRPDNILLATENGVVRPYVADFDVAYYEHVFKVRRSTILPLGMPRYLPPELFGNAASADDSDYRDPKIDLYGVAVVIFDLFVGAGVPIPAPRTARSFVQAFGRSEIETAKSLQSRIARFLSLELALDAAKRSSSASDMSRAWGRVREPAWVRPAVLAGSLGLAMALLEVSDWISHRGSLSQTSRIAERVFGGGVALLSALGGAAAVQGTVAARVSRAQSVIVQGITKRPRWGLAGVMVLAALPFAGLKVSGLWSRIHTYRILTDFDCQLLDERAKTIGHALAGQVQRRTFPEIPARIQCPNREPTVLPASFLSPSIGLEATKPTFDAPPTLTADRLPDRIRSGSLRVLDLLSLTNSKIILAAERANDVLLRNPDGDIYEHAVYVIRLAQDNIDILRITTQPMMSVDDNRNGALTEVNGEVIAFINYKVGEGDYGMGGTTYRIRVEGSKLNNYKDTPLFGGEEATRKNWGFMPYFDGDAVVHFGYSGHLKIRDATVIGEVSPEEMLKEREQRQRAHSEGRCPSEQRSLASYLFPPPKTGL